MMQGKTLKILSQKIALKASILLALALFVALPYRVSYAEDAEGTFVYKTTPKTEAKGEGMLSSVKTAWTKTVRAFGDYFHLSRPAAYATPVMDDARVYTGSTGKKFFAFDLSTGKKLWSFKADAKAEGGAAVTDEAVYFGSTRGTLYAVNKTTGELIWKSRVRSEIQSAPVVHGGRVYFSTIDGHVYAFDAKTGVKAWGYMDAATDYVHIRFRSSVAVDGERAYAVFPSGYAAAVDASTGRELWRIRLLKEAYPDANVTRTPVVASSYVYMLDNDGYLTAFDTKSGVSKIRYDVRGVVDFSLSGDIIALTTTDKVVAVKRTTGEMLWSDASSVGPSRYLVTDGSLLLLVGNYEWRLLGSKHLEFDSTRLVLYSAAAGERLWEKDYFKHQLSRPSMTEGNAAFVNEKALLRLLSAK